MKNKRGPNYFAMASAGVFLAAWVYLIAAVSNKAWDPFLWPAPNPALTGWLMTCAFGLGAVIAGAATDKTDPIQ